MPSQPSARPTGQSEALQHDVMSSANTVSMRPTGSSEACKICLSFYVPLNIQEFLSRKTKV
jgi:hypothetical protein